MSRMVRESTLGGLRERLYFARLLLRELKQGVDAGKPRAFLLALRSAVFLQLYTVPVGLARAAAAAYNVRQVDTLTDLGALSQAFRDQQIDAPEFALIEQARTRHDDPLYWLEQQVRELFGAGGLGQRPAPPDDQALALQAEDPYEPLGRGDIERLDDCLARLETLREECLPYMEEW